MKNLLVALVLASAATSANAFDFFGNNDGEWKMGPQGPYWEEGSDWPQWTPMYWMEEFMDGWDDNGNYGSNFGAMPYGAYPQQPMMPYGYGAQMPAAPMMPQAPVAVPAPAAPQAATK